MRFDFPPFSLVFFAGGCLALYLACVFYARRPAHGAIQLTWFALFCALWTIGSGLEAGVVKESHKIMFAQIEYPGVAGAALCWLAFALDFSGSRWWRRPRNIILMSIIPFITLILIITNKLHHLYWAGTVLVPGSFGPILIYERGPWYWVFVAFTYAVYISGAVIILIYGFKNQRLYRTQILAICLAIAIPFVGSILYLTGAFPVRGLDLAPFLSILAGVAFALTIFRWRFLDVVPIARSALVEKMPDGIVVVNANGLIVDMNSAAERIIGVARIDGMGNPAEKVWPKMREILSSTKRGTRFDIVLERPDSKMFLDVDVTPVLIQKQMVSGQLLVFRDNTERRKMQQNLKESESRYSTLVEQSNEGVLIVQEGIYVFVNRTIVELTRYSAEEILGQEITFLVDQEDRKMIQERYQLRQAGKDVPRNYEVRMRRKDGERRSVEISVGNIRYEGAEATIVSVRDIAERLKAQRQLENLYGEERNLGKALQLEIEKRSRYTRALVHELKTPLTAIASSTAVLETEVTNEIYLALVKNIGRATLNLEQRIEELVELDRGEIGMLKIEPVELDLAVLLREIVSEMTPVGAAKGLVILQDIPDLAKVIGDRSRLRQVMTNLLSNATKFTSRGSILIKAANCPGHEVLVQVSDTGRGMNAEEVENIFDPYKRKMSAGHDMHGLGIGLALSKMFVELHHGKIKAESVPGKGSTFSFTVPVYQKYSGPAGKIQGGLN